MQDYWTLSIFSFLMREDTKVKTLICKTLRLCAFVAIKNIQQYDFYCARFFVKKLDNFKLPPTFAALG